MSQVEVRPTNDASAHVHIHMNNGFPSHIAIGTHWEKITTIVYTIVYFIQNTFYIMDYSQETVPFVSRLCTSVLLLLIKLNK